MMLIKCNICHRETEQTVVKQKHYAYNLLCPECLFLAKQPKQPAGPEKMILRILHEYLVKQKVVSEQKFVIWKWMPDFRDKKCPDFWAECIFGDFLKREYQCGGIGKTVSPFSLPEKYYKIRDTRSRCLLPDVHSAIG